MQTLKIISRIFFGFYLGLLFVLMTGQGASAQILAVCSYTNQGQDFCLTTMIDAQVAKHVDCNSDLQGCCATVMFEFSHSPSFSGNTFTVNVEQGQYFTDLAKAQIPVQDIVTDLGLGNGVFYMQAIGCSSTSTTSVNFTVHVPNPVISQSDPVSICQGEDTVLTLISTAGFTAYDWIPSPETGASLTISTANSYTVTVTDDFGCTGTSEAVEVVVNPLPDPIVNDTIICLGEFAVLQVTPNYPSILWENSETTQSIEVSPEVTTIYDVSVIDANGCSGNSDGTVHLYTDVLAIPTFSGETDICTGTAGVNFAVDNFTYDAESYLWNSPDGSAERVSFYGNQGAVFNFPGSGEAIIQLQVSDLNGCTKSFIDTIMVSSQSAPEVPDVVLVGSSPDLWLVCQYNGADSLRWGFDRLINLESTPDSSVAATLQQYRPANGFHFETRSYWVKVYEDNCFTKSYYGNLIGIDDDINVAVVGAYPNPSNGEIKLTSNFPMQGYTVTDLAGRIIESGSFLKNSVLETRLQLHNGTGIYLLTVETNVGTQTIKLSVW